MYDIIHYIMRKYELMVVAKSDFPHEDEKKRKALIEKLLTDQEGYTNLKVDDLGKKQLAYEINKQTEGCYILATFEANAIHAGKIEQQVKLTDSVLRYLLTRAD